MKREIRQNPEIQTNLKSRYISVPSRTDKAVIFNQCSMAHRFATEVPQDLSPLPTAWCALTVVRKLKVCFDNLMSVCCEMKKLENHWISDMHHYVCPYTGQV